MPVYNGENFLEATLDSLRAQTFGDYELIISDNASTDRTREICEDYAAGDSRICYCRSDTNVGAARNFNRVFKLTRGKYFKWAAHDDLCAPEFMARCVDVLDRDPSVVLVQSRVRPIDREGRVLSNPEVGLLAMSYRPHIRFYHILQAHMCYEIFGMIRADALHRTPLMGNYPHGDGVLLAWLGLLGRFYEVPEYLFYSRRHPDQAGTRLPDRYQWAEWFDPAMKRRIVLPHWRMFGEYLRAIHGVPIDRWQRLCCYGYMVHWLIWYRKKLLYNLAMTVGQIPKIFRAERRDSGARHRLAICRERKD
jgi:glycosyltransferase involved in cell wall biosynthesis